MDRMTISALARAVGLSRSTLLYYDRLGLLRPARRSAAGYRLYSTADASRLEQICLHRQMGISLKEIAVVLKATGANAAVDILRRRLKTLDRSIEEMRSQQRQIVEILKQDSLQKKEVNVINK